MPVFRVSIFSTNTNTRTGGWTENWWNNAPSQAVALDRAKGLAIRLNTLRGYGPVQTRIRISQYGVRRSGRTFPINIPNAIPANSTLFADYPTTKIQIRLTGSSGNATTQWLGGVIDEAVINAGFFVPTANVQNAWLPLRTELITVANGWSTNVLNPANTPKVITAFASDTGVFTTGAVHGFNNNDFVRVMRVNGVPGINGIWQVTDVTSITFRIIGWKSTTATMTRSNATAVKQEHVPFPISDVEAVQATSHRVGKPAGQLGGRRRRPGTSLVGPLVAK